MSTENIDIVVSETGSQKASANIAGVGDAADKSAKQVDGFTQAMTILGTVVTAVAVEKLVAQYRELSDTFTGITNRLKLVSTSAQDLANTEQQLLQVANNTRGSFEQTANLYNKLALNAGALGIDQKSLIPVLQTVNQLIAVSGANATEAKNGLLQFSQGLASNRFQGQDLKAVLEDLPQLGQAIAKGLGTTTSGLRQMGEQGQLSAKIVLDALQKSAPEVAKQFAALTPTIGQAFQVLKNNILDLVGTFDKLHSGSSTIAQAILFIANNLGTLVRAIETAVITIAGFYVALAVQSGWQAFAAGVEAAYIRLNAYVVAAAAAGVETTVLSRAMVAFQTPIAALTNGFRALWAVIVANPIAAVITILIAAAAYVYSFGNQIKLTSDGSITLLGAFVGAWNYLLQKLGEVYTYLSTTLGPYFKVFWEIISAPVVLVYNALNGLLTLLSKFIPSLAAINTDKIGKDLVQAMKDASKSTQDATLASADFGNQWTKTGDQVAAGAAVAKHGIDGVVVGGTQMGRVAADAIPPFENLINRAKQLDAVMEKAKANFDKTHQEVIAIGEAEKAAANQTRDAMGHIVTYTDEADKETGRLFDNITAGANSSASAVDNLASSFNSAASAASSLNSASQPLTGSRSVDTGGNTQSTNPALEGGVSTDNGQTFHSVAEDIAYFKQYGRPLTNAANANDPTPWRQLLDEVGNDDALAAAVKAAAHARHVPGFADGGAFTVGGSGGVDSQLVQFMASPDETVTVQNKNQIRRARSGYGDGGGIVVNMTVKTPDANSFRRSGQQILLGLKGKLAQV